MYSLVKNILSLTVYFVYAKTLNLDICRLNTKVDIGILL